MNEAWECEHSLDCPVPTEFAWRFWTDVNNWRLDADIESVELNGLFAAGSSGVTVTRSSGRVEWRLVTVHPGKGAVVEIPIQGAIAHFHWTFEDLGGRTRITQRASIEGEGALALVQAMAPMIESSLAVGMQGCASS